MLKESSQTTKLRVVFDASAKSSNGLSLNDNLLIGPNLQQDLFSILIRFRTYNFVISGDIEKMYRQVLIDTKHVNYQRILWRENSSEPLKTYQLNTVTYGTSPAKRCIKQLAFDNRERFPVACENILENFYMDDLLCGADTLASALKLQSEIIHILKQGQFHLYKWSSNDPNLIPQSQTNKNTVYFTDNNETKTLGLIWNSNDDQLKYKVNETETKIELQNA